MKKLVMVSDESLIAGVVKCGIAEVVDSLANSMTADYDVTVVCPEGNSIFIKVLGDATKVNELESGVKTFRISKVTYYMIDLMLWSDKVVQIVDSIKPDILHNFSEIELLSRLQNKPPKVIFTFDNTDCITDREDYLAEYDGTTTVSVSYADSLKCQRSMLSRSLNSTDFRGITNGILDTVIAPEKGLFLPAKFTALNQTGKKACKRRLMETYGIKGDPCIYLLMSRLSEEKNIEGIIDAIPTIKETGGMLLVVGRGNRDYETRLKQFKRSDGVLYVQQWASPLRAAPLNAAADFLLQPSLEESCGLMPMTASRYGAIPIVTLNGGLADNFNEENAIIVDEDNVSDGIIKAAALYADEEALAAKRKICMEKDFSWRTRKQGYIELYEKETD